MFKRSKPNPEVMKISTPTHAIADLMVQLTYSEMVNMAERIKTLADENPNATMAHILNLWAREVRGVRIPAAAIVAGSIMADKIVAEDKPLRPAPPVGGENREALDRMQRSAPPPPTIPAHREPAPGAEGLPAAAT